MKTNNTMDSNTNYEPEDDVKVRKTYVLGKKQAETIEKMGSKKKNGKKPGESKVMRQLLKDALGEKKDGK